MPGCKEVCFHNVTQDDTEDRVPFKYADRERLFELANESFGLG